MTPSARRAWIALASALVAAPALAQLPAGMGGGGGQEAPVSHFSLSPYIGLAYPTMNLLSLTSGTGAGATTQDLKLSAAVVGGVRVDINFNSRIGISLDGGYSPGSLEYANNAVTTNTDITTITGVGKLTVYLIPSTSFFWVNVSGGAGAIRHSFKSTSAAFTGLKDATNVGGVVGAAAGLRIWKLISLTAQVEDYLYNASFENGSTKTAERKQHDLRFTGGIGFPFLGI